MNILRRAAVGAATLGLAATGVGVGLAQSASAAPPVHHTITSTAQTVRTQRIGPNITVTTSNEFSASTSAPGYSLTGRLVDVCFRVPHAIPPTATTVLAVCNWQLTSVPGTTPASRLFGNTVQTGLREVGRVTGGTGEWAGAFSVLPNQTTFANIAPRTQADVFNFFLP